jgi:hypothetical protein
MLIALVVGVNACVDEYALGMHNAGQRVAQSTLSALNPEKKDLDYLHLRQFEDDSSAHLSPM